MTAKSIPSVTPSPKERILSHIRALRSVLNALETDLLEYVEEAASEVTLLRVLTEEAAAEFSVKPSWVAGRLKLRPIWEARAARNYVFREITGMNATTIARLMDRNHKSILNSFEYAAQMMRTDPKYKEHVDRLLALHLTHAPPSSTQPV